MQPNRDWTEPGPIARNAVILLSTLAVLVALFAAYWALVPKPGAGGGRGGPRSPQLPVARESDQQPVVRIADVELPAGSGMEFTIYDEHTGRPRENFRCASYTPVPGSRNEVLVQKPELTMRLPSGMIATISADEGQITVDRVDSSRGRPKLGWLRGDARIVIDRHTRAERTPLAERPEDAITILMEQLDFNLEAGSLQTAGPIRASAPEFDVRGTGLTLVWNQLGNRVEVLEVQRGEELVLNVESGLLGPAREPLERPGESVSSARTGDRATPRAAGRERGTIYRCILTGGVAAQHYQADRLVGGLEAERLELLFDVGGEAGAMLGRGPSEAASQPADAPRERVVVRWSGPLSLAPVGEPPAGENQRRRLHAAGQVVHLRLPDGAIRCGGISFHEEEQRLWLRPAPDGRVHVELGARLTATAQSVYYERAKQHLKLVGDVRIRSAPQAAQAGERMTIRCDLWAELELDAGTGGPAAALESQISNPQTLSAEALRAARFVGSVRVDRSDQRLAAHELTARFRPAAGGGSPDNSLDRRLETIEASGEVRLESEDRLLEASSLTMHFQPQPGADPFPHLVEAFGAVRMVDVQRRFSGRGRSLAARFDKGAELQQATVLGLPRRPAAVRARGYAVRGERIELDAGGGTELRSLHVPGPSVLHFRSRRSLQGREQARPVTTRVTSRESLRVEIGPDGGVVHFVGDVVARSGEEELIADSLTLTLEDAPRAAAGERGRPRESQISERPLESEISDLKFQQHAAVLRFGAESLLGSAATRAWDAGLAAAPLAGRAYAALTGRPGPAAAGRGPQVADIPPQEPVRLVARNAVVQSESRISNFKPHQPGFKPHEPGGDLPLVHQSIAAPELDIDIRARIIRSIGHTRLYLIDRRAGGGDAGAAQAVVVPSALMSRGPSQTVLSADRAMTYSLGREEVGRRDRVVFEGGVRFRHVTGREMVQFEKMLPQGREDPRLLEQLRDRNVYLESERLEGEFVAEAAGGEGQPAALQLVWLIATGQVYLRDQQQDAVRSVDAAQIEFDRSQSLIRVLGGEGAAARVYNENRRTRRLDVPVVGPEIVIDMQNNTIRTRSIRGEVRGR